MVSSISPAEAAEEILRRRAARTHLLDFVRYTRRHYQAAWYHKLICEYLEAFIRGEIKRLLIETPPRHGKSELVSRCLPAYIFGQRPTASIISCSYSADLAQMMNRDVQRIMDSPEYLQLFPDSILSSSNIRTVSGNWLRNADVFEVVKHGGIYRCAGVGGGITGMGGNYIILDDPIKNQEEANSSTYRNKIWDWYTSTLYTRLHGEPQSILLTLTRWHEDDLAGRLLARAKEDSAADQWVTIKLEAVKEGPPTDLDPRQEGEALWPERFNLDRLATIKASTTPSVWASLFQQRPAPVEGTIIKRDWIRHYERLPDTLDAWWQSWDLNFEDTDDGSYVVGQVWARAGANCYLVHQYRERVDFVASLRAVANMTGSYPQALRKKVEKKANGAALLSVCRTKIAGLVPVTPVGDKEQRLRAVSPLFEAGNVWVPSASMAPWVSDYVDEMSTFPKSPHNDQVDATSQALSDIQTNRVIPFNLDLTVGVAPSYWSGLA